MAAIVNTLITIAQGVIIVVIGDWLSTPRTTVFKVPHTMPHRNAGSRSDSVQIPLRSRVRTVLVLSIELIIISFVLYEVHQPGDLTRNALFKIAFGIGAFFFLLLQTTIVSAFGGLVNRGPDEKLEKGGGE